MMSLVMLGIIPGTNIQITFESWLAAMLLFTVITAAIFTYRRRATLLPAANKFVRQATDSLRATARTA